MTTESSYTMVTCDVCGHEWTPSDALPGTHVECPNEDCHKRVLVTREWGLD